MRVQREKYENISNASLVKALDYARNKRIKMIEKHKKDLKEQEDFIKFLEKKAKAQILQNKPVKPKKTSYRLHESPTVQKLDKWARENPELAAEIEQELMEEMAAFQ